MIFVATVWCIRIERSVHCSNQRNTQFIYRTIIRMSQTHHVFDMNLFMEEKNVNTYDRPRRICMWMAQIVSCAIGDCYLYWSCTKPKERKTFLLFFLLSFSLHQWWLRACRLSMFSLWYRSMCSNHSVIVAYNWYLNFWADNSHIYKWHKQLTCYCPRAQNVFFLSIDYRYSVQEFIDIWPEAHNLLLFAKYTHQVS